ncbi:DUF2877 domain-containing protein [Nocardioides sp. GCM10027113]|uniref:oxamate carbamoyltransferase subunit AllH family protein n=1 Tax=unclassified Nocardioides TaxID=2615069 RepID=UPI003606DAA9
MSRSQRVPQTVPDRVPASAPRRVLERLRAAPEGPVPVVHRGPAAVYADLGGWCVGVLATGAVQVPNAVRTRLPHLGASAPVVHVAAGVLHLDGSPLVVGRVEDVAVRALGPDAARRLADVPVPAHDGWSEALDLLATRAPHGIDPAAVARLVGHGSGLTPLGDDLVAGFLATSRALGTATPDVDRAVRDHLSRTTLLSATLLDCALHGEALPELRAWLTTPGPAAAERTAALLAVGHTSGAGLLAGARHALTRTPTEGAHAA